MSAHLVEESLPLAKECTLASKRTAISVALEMCWKSHAQTFVFELLQLSHTPGARAAGSSDGRISAPRWLTVRDALAHLAEDAPPRKSWASWDQRIALQLENQDRDRVLDVENKAMDVIHDIEKLDSSIFDVPCIFWCAAVGCEMSMRMRRILSARPNFPGVDFSCAPPDGCDRRSLYIGRPEERESTCRAARTAMLSPFVRGLLDEELKS